MVAELFEGGNLGANLHNVAEDLYFFGAALDREPTRARSLESDELYCIPRVWQPLSQVMQNPATGRHSAG
jgi:hypothetical protein